MNYNQINPPAGAHPLMDERDFLMNFLHSIDVLVVILDKNGSLIRFNKACERLFGYSTDEIQSKLETGFLPLPGGALGAIKNILKSIRYAKNTETYETEWPTKQGEVRTITWSVKTMMDENGEVEFILATGTDITNQKAAEIKLRQEKYLLRSLINSIPDLVFYKDINGVYFGCNQAFDEFSGHVIQGWDKQHTDFDFYPPEVAEEFAQTDLEVLTSKKTLRYENRIFRPAENEIILETRKSPYYGPDNELLGVIGISRDITHQKKSDEALRKANARIEQLIASLSSILIVISKDYRVIHWNPSASKVLGIAKEIAIGNPLEKLKIAWDFQPIAEYIALCEKTYNPQYMDPVSFKRLDGVDGYLGLNISPFFENDTQLSGFILLGGDITERKAFESQLAQMQKLKSIGQLAAGIAHEINTPIQYISDNTMFLKKSVADLLVLADKFEQLLRKLHQENFHTEQITEIEETIQQIDLSFLRTETPLAINQSLDGIQRVTEIVRAMKELSHPGMVEMLAIDINKTIENTLTVARNEWKYIADIQTDLALDLPKITGLPGEINQAIINVIINAAQAIDEFVQKNPGEKGTISINTRSEGDWVEIQICDTGPGIPEHIQPHIFEPFYTTKDVGKGTGQGLAIAYNIIVIKHRGHLSFRTKEGQGTCFIIRLPISHPES